MTAAKKDRGRTASPSHRGGSANQGLPAAARRRPAEVVARVRPVADRLAEAHRLLVWDVTFEREAGREMLRVACDRAGGIGSDELAVYAEDLSRELDRVDVVAGGGRYLLEVTSPGAERRLKTPEQFRVCSGRFASVSLQDGRKVEGTIGDVTDTTLDIDTDQGVSRVFLSDVSRAQLVLRGA